MLLDLKKIEHEGVVIDAPLMLPPLQGPGGLPARVEGARIQGLAVPGERGVEFRGTFRAEVELACSRCLRLVPWQIEIRDLYLLLTTKARDSDSAIVQEAEFFAGEEGRIDLVEVATEQIYLQLPLKPVCRPDCRGLCPQCGADRNDVPCDCAEQGVDPRLAPLLQFRRPNGGA